MTDQGRRTVVVTGVSGQWGNLLARRLLRRPELRVLGIDRNEPSQTVHGLDFVKADVRNPLLAELLRVEGVDAVVHLAFRERQWRREEDFESNVLGAMHLVGSCVDAGVKQVVLKSTMAVYGATPDSPHYAGEDWPLTPRATYGYLRDALEIERFLGDFKAEYPEMRLAILRFANITGPLAKTPFTRLLGLPVIPSLLGFDPLLQVIDAEDVVAALERALLTRADGAFNVAADGVLPLGKLAAIAGRPLLPILHLCIERSWHPLAALPSGRRILAWYPLEPHYLRYPCTGDLGRMRQQLGFEPQRDAQEAVLHHVQALRAQRYDGSNDSRPFAGDRLGEAIDDRRRGREGSDGHRN